MEITMMKDGTRICYHNNGEVSDSNGNIINYGKINTNGKRVTKTPYSNPYDYEDFMIFGDINQNLENSLKNRLVAQYSDNLYMGNYSLYSKLEKEIFQDEDISWSKRSKSKIEKFLQDFQSDESIKLYRLSQGCNSSNGYPYWIFEYTTDLVQ